jgi:nucleotide-binding universal stress UspA family protein
LEKEREREMIPVIKKILYTTDLSKNSAHAFRYAVALAKKFDAEIVILHVVEELSENVRVLLDDDVIKKRINGMKKKETERIKERLKRFCDREFEGDRECADRVMTIDVRQGYPVEEILTKAEEMDCDAIVMGTHGKGMVTHAFLGSVAEHVLRQITRPAFVIPLPKGEHDLTVHDI